MKKKKKKSGVTDFALDEHLSLKLAKKATVAASPKILQLELWREMFSAKYRLSGPIKGI